VDFKYKFFFCHICLLDHKKEVERCKMSIPLWSMFWTTPWEVYLMEDQSVLPQSETYSYIHTIFLAFFFS
jgi:hypothetical protein